LVLVQDQLWVSTFLWQAATPVIWGWFAGRTCKNNRWLYTWPPKLLCNFYGMYKICKCSRLFWEQP